MYFVFVEVLGCLFQFCFGKEQEKFVWRFVLFFFFQSMLVLSAYATMYLSFKKKE